MLPPSQMLPPSSSVSAVAGAEPDAAAESVSMEEVLDELFAEEFIEILSFI